MSGSVQVGVVSALISGSVSSDWWYVLCTATAFKNARGKNTGGKNTGGKMAKKAKEDEGQNDDMQLMY